MKIFNLAEELEKERQKNKELEKQLNCKKEFTKYLPKDTEFIILTKPDYDRQQEELQDKVFELQYRIDKIKKYIEETRESDSSTILPSGKTTDIEYCLVVLEDIEDLLNGKELKGE